MHASVKNKKLSVRATSYRKGVSLAKLMYSSHKSNVTNDEWHFLFVIVFTVGFSKCGHF